jgi:hypothetical protein
LGGLGSKGAIFFHCSVSNGPLRAIGPPSALLILLISHFRKLNHSLLNALYKVVQQLLAHIGMVGPQRFLINRQRTPEQRLRPRIVALVLQQ